MYSACLPAAVTLLPLAEYVEMLERKRCSQGGKGVLWAVKCRAAVMKTNAVGGGVCQLHQG